MALESLIGPVILLQIVGLAIPGLVVFRNPDSLSRAYLHGHNALTIVKDVKDFVKPRFETIGQEDADAVFVLNGESNDNGVACTQAHVPRFDLSNWLNMKVTLTPLRAQPLKKDRDESECYRIPPPKTSFVDKMERDVYIYDLGPEQKSLYIDWWHSDIGMKFVGLCPTSSVVEAVEFHPDHGPCTVGVSMILARLGAGFEQPQRMILNDILDPLIGHIPCPVLVISWPGYGNSKQPPVRPGGSHEKIPLRRPLVISHKTTVADLARQVADHLYVFSEMFSACFNPTIAHGIRLGPEGVKFEQLRLVRLYSLDAGCTWCAEVAIAYDLDRPPPSSHLHPPLSNNNLNMSYGGGYGGHSGHPPPPGGGGGYGRPGGYGPPAGGPTGGGGYGGPPAGGYGGAPGGGYGGPPGGGYGGAGAAGGGYGAAGGHAGGFAPPGGQGPPPGADPQLWNWFTSVDADRSGAITAPELERALINGDWTPFDLDTVKLLMTIFDTDRSGTIGFNEVCVEVLRELRPPADTRAQFAGLWKYIKDWQNVFKHFDRDRSGSIDGSELRDALAQFGFNLSPHLLVLVQRKYDPKATNSAPSHGMPSSAPAGISFDRFVRACVVVKQLSEAFGRIDTDRDGWIQIGYDQFMETVLQLP
ncbi:unnamed protein product [Mycena citricolor]|uniref:EF-hand domain-containing protein n=1 Tax=Mycena citricolor TaxID=2018698 RepID=A0AAD2HUB4_9AGAR|nr:unnamed protein product [Mycena citricolor]